MSKYKVFIKSIVVILILIFACSYSIFAYNKIFLDTKINHKPPYASGIKVYSKNGIDIDYSNTCDGYVMVSCSHDYGKVKVQIINNNQTYNYDLVCDGKYAVYPLQMGDGTYIVRALKHVGNSRYALIGAKDVVVSLNSSLAPYLLTNEIIKYTDDSETIKKSFELTKDAKTDLEKVDIIYNYVISNITYDYEKATTVQKGYLPNIDDTLATKKGICFDYAAVLASMLRAQNIPTKLVTGYVSPSGAYHAWNEIYIVDEGWVSSGIYFDGVSWKRVDPTFASEKNNSKYVIDYIENDENYKVKYNY